jgi:hypothetical protein
MEGKWTVAEAIRFYKTCLKETIEESFGISDLCASIFGLLFPLVMRVFHPSETTMSGLSWKIPLYAFACFGALRLILSPFLVYKKLSDEKKAADKKLAEKIAERTPKIVCKDYTLQPTPMVGSVQAPTVSGLIVTIPGETVTSRLWIQLIPKCATEEPAEKCKGHLVAIFRKNAESKWEKTGFNEVSFLKWSACNETEIALEPRAERRLCVCYTDELTTALHPDAQFIHARALNDLRLPGTFSFDIKITADKCDPVYVSLEVGFDGLPLDDRPRCVLRQGYTSA